jgi:hypothetical protein
MAYSDSPFSTANLALVAYALVKADGTSSEINSGVGTTHLVPDRYGNEVYEIILPGKEGVQETLQQGQGNSPSGSRRDLIFVCPTGSASMPVHAAPVSTIDVDEFVKQILIGPWTEEHPILEFFVLVFRTTIPTPTDSSGSQNGPT